MASGPSQTVEKDGTAEVRPGSIRESMADGVYLVGGADKYLDS